MELKDSYYIICDKSVIGRKYNTVNDTILGVVVGHTNGCKPFIKPFQSNIPRHFRVIQ